MDKTPRRQRTPSGSRGHSSATRGSSGAKQRTWTEPDTRPSVVLNNFIAKQATAGEVLDVFAERSREFMIVNYVTALHRIAKFGHHELGGDDWRLQQLLREMIRMCPP
mmetsp:Transcript_71791/g.153470  ORF Transcript_71791/g.153470 Transcript_71791/m.153470 type:complete len:108 (+) Transcript_71791:199-522(+)